MLRSFFSLPRLPSFDPALEIVYRSSRNRRAARTNVVAAVIIIVVYNVFLLSDLELIPDVVRLSAYLRLGLVTPLIVVILIVQQRIVQLRPASALPGHLNAFLGVAVFASVMALQVATKANTAAEYFTGSLLVLVGFNSVRHGSINDQMFGTVAMCIIFWFGIDAATVVSSETKTDAILSVFVCGALTLLGVYRSEYAERSSFRAEAQAQHMRDALAERNAELERLTYVDALTGIANRRAFEEVLRAGAHTTDGAVLMIDVDHFKAYNDNYGHPAGDRCLAQIAAALAREIRAADCIARFGGEEFAVLLRDASLSDIKRIGERLRAAVEDLAIPHAARPDGVRRVTVSIGAQPRRACDPHSLDECLALADAALYRSKARGRNRFTLEQAIAA